MSSDSTRLFFSVSGTSPLTMRCASPSTMAVLPTPGSPISTGLFLVRRCRIWITRRISSSRPMTGSSLPARARSVRSSVYFFNDSRCPSASCEPHRLTAPHGVDRLFQRRAGGAGLLEQAPGLALVVASAASRNISEAMNWSPRFCASLSVRLSRLASSRETLTSPPCPSTLGRRSVLCLSAARRPPTLTPARDSSDVVPPSCWLRLPIASCYKKAHSPSFSAE